MLLLLASRAGATTLTVFSESRSQSSDGGNQIWHGNPKVGGGGGQLPCSLGSQSYFYAFSYLTHWLIKPVIIQIYKLTVCGGFYY